MAKRKIDGGELALYIIYGVIALGGLARARYILIEMVEQRTGIKRKASGQ